VAIAFAARFYRRLARGEILEKAMSEARRRLAIRDQYKLEWGIPVLYLRSPGELIGPRPLWLHLRTWGLRVLLAWIMIGFKGASDSYTCPSPPDVYIRFTRIPVGSIWVRSGEGRDAAKREVYLRKPLCVSTYEVTQHQWEKVMGKNPSKVKGRDLPVTNFNMADFKDFSSGLNSRGRGANYRLLNDMEWEYAARGRTTGDFYFDGDAEDLYRYGNCKGSDDGYENITSVGSFPANPFGLQDVYGNVSELVSDRYADKEPPVQVSSPDSQELPAESWIHRGGSWNHKYWNCNSVHRFYMSEQTRARDDVGLRLARDPVRLY
jgi:formylglycine-generating enzyme required for sulfatase activity